MADKKVTPDPADANPNSVQTIVIKDGKATAPKRRMATASAAWSAYTNIRTLSAKRDLRYGDIAGIFAGFPPTPPSVLLDMSSTSSAQSRGRPSAKFHCGRRECARS